MFNKFNLVLHLFSRFIQNYVLIVYISFYIVNDFVFTSLLLFDFSFYLTDENKDGWLAAENLPV